MAQVKSYTRRSRRGKIITVRSHHRRVKNPRGDYGIVKDRQLKRRSPNVFVDAQIQALPPGKRKSKNHRVYYERRFNRSDSGKYL